MNKIFNVLFFIFLAFASFSAHSMSDNRKNITQEGMKAWEQLLEGWEEEAEKLGKRLKENQEKKTILTSLILALKSTFLINY